MYLETRNKNHKNWKGRDRFFIVHRQWLRLGKPQIIKVISITKYKFSKAIQYKINTESSRLYICKEKLEWRHRRKATTGNNKER